MRELKPYQDKQTLERLIREAGSYKGAAIVLGVNEKTVTAWAKKFGIASAGSQGARRHSLDKGYFHNIDTEPKAYWLGFLMADGCVYVGSGKNSLRLQVNLQISDKDILEKFNKAISSDYNITEKQIYNKKTKKTYAAAQLKINCTSMCKDLIKHNVTPRKSLVCTMPEISPDLIRHYIRGYLDGDGHIGRDKINRWEMDFCGGKSMMQTFQNYFENHGIVSAIYKINHSKAVSLTINSRECVKKAKDLLYEGATVYLERKFRKLDDLEKYLSRQTETSGQ